MSTSTERVRLEPEVEALGPLLCSGRRAIHQFPEAGFEEVRTAEAVPGCFAFVGSANPARGLDHPHHSPRFDFDEAALPIGVQVLVRTAERFLREEPR